MPWLFVKGQICEAMGWTFEEFDRQPYDEVMGWWRLRGLYKEHEADLAERMRESR